MEIVELVYTVGNHFCFFPLVACNVSYSLSHNFLDFIFHLLAFVPLEEKEKQTSPYRAHTNCESGNQPLPSPKAPFQPPSLSRRHTYAHLFREEKHSKLFIAPTPNPFFFFASKKNFPYSRATMVLDIMADTYDEKIRC